jgi:CBS domain-containing protein
MLDMKKSFSDLLVGDVYDLVIKEPATVRTGSKIREAFDEYLKNPGSRKVYVVDEEGKLLGAVTTETLLRLLGYRVGVREFSGLSLWRMFKEVFKEDVDRVFIKIAPVKQTDKLTKALQIMIDNHFNDLPVVDGEGRLIGELNSMELFLKGRELFEK